MRRKSERNKAKGSPEKKVEKPTRRTTRRRGKTSPSTSPERENMEDNISSTPHSDEDKESRLQSIGEDHSNDNKESGKAVSSNEIITSILGQAEEDNGSVWKVARQDASPGEIQKLKLCRQRNISEASDSSLSKKQSNKWQDSGEGGTEEADSADEQIASSQKMIISEQTEDPSSLHPGQDSNEEVSDYKENLPETTSANLSDDKTNIDQLADYKENLPQTSNLSKPNYEDNQSSTNLDDDNSHLDQSPDYRDNLAELTSGNLSRVQQNQDSEGKANEPTCDNAADIESHESTNVTINSSMNNEYTNYVISIEKSTKVKEEAIVNISVASCVGETEQEEIFKKSSISEQETLSHEEKNTESVSSTNETVDTNFKTSHKGSKSEEEEEEGEIREEIEKESSPFSDAASSVKNELNVHDIELTSGTNSLQEKPDKCHDPSNSDTPESDDDHNKIRNTEDNKNIADSSNAEESTKKSRKEKRNLNQKTQSAAVEKNSISGNVETEIELLESTAEKEDILEINEKSDDLNVSVSTSKPAKVSLKRSFSTRLSTDSETKKEDNTVKKPSVNESNQNKENHANNEQPDKKSATKRRRWGMTTSTDVSPAFSISTDSLKALVPGAKPLPANEVRLSKDEDDEKEQQKNKDEISGEFKVKNDTISKSDVIKKLEVKMDNHIALRRKITVVKETPRPKSLSPPEAQATNILLIKNLVRPFTLNQIKELLSRTGTIVENGFWMDRIKSKCFVEYANEDQAFETRQALHGVSWPPSNPKKLIVDYATKEDMEMAREISKDQPVTRKVEPLLSTDLWQQDHWSREDRSTVNKITVIREWDLGKEDGQLHIKEKERERKEFEKKKRQRSRSPIVEAHLPAPARKFKKKEEEPPTAKLLDDLFRKTKSTPCIYWLPLTNEQIIVKEEMRRQHMAEHARRLEEMRRAERNRDTRRRRSPRK